MLRGSACCCRPYLSQVLFHPHQPVPAGDAHVIHLVQDVAAVVHERQAVRVSLVPFGDITVTHHQDLERDTDGPSQPSGLLHDDVQNDPLLVRGRVNCGCSKYAFHRMSVCFVAASYLKTTSASMTASSHR